MGVFVTWDWPGSDGLSHKVASAGPFATSFRFEATILDLEDVSYQHASHVAVKANPNSASGETHFNLKIVSPKFEGLNLVKRHRLVYDALADELQSGLHALSIVAKTPQELESQPLADQSKISKKDLQSV
ncbi:sufE-like protein 1, chloroplastic/mitochondrial [Ziziphus jujuba]|uniref:SufE-like protein 1, chloroplastic/mitochondrial n=1 Tax=Ziziphus jujuba TaxID=326968 RepID=A0ABM3ZRU5_ZIZJJ|nr:sufE-like protein 1, chloroplastic/mitochondrial [Ziziphus jujuba]